MKRKNHSKGRSVLMLPDAAASIAVLLLALPIMLLFSIPASAKTKPLTC